jgi:hypothetical protein
MSPSELFDIWAPPAAPWSRWAKPVLFAELDAAPGIGVDLGALPAASLSIPQPSAIVVDLPSAESVRMGLALARLESLKPQTCGQQIKFSAGSLPSGFKDSTERGAGKESGNRAGRIMKLKADFGLKRASLGYRPVPLFNGARGPRPLLNLAAAIVDNEPIVAWLTLGAELLVQPGLPDEAPPAFLLDARRKPEALAPAPGRFDNRWIVFPQDFPSANFLRAHGIQQALLLQSEPERPPQADLAHVLRRWQEAGMSLFVGRPDDPNPPRPLQVARPSRFRWLWYGALAAAGLRRNSAGGFGSIVPQPSSSGG